MARKSSTKKVSGSTQVYLDKLNKEVGLNQSRLSMVLGILIIIVAGILLFNYFNRGTEDLGPAQQTTTQQEGDVSPENLPGKYTVKEGDTLFLIAEKYYGDGFKYPEIVSANNLANADVVEVGQVLEIPKLEGVSAPTASPEVTATPEPTASPEAEQMPTEAAPGSKGAADVTMQQDWGPAITGDTYTVVEGDWLSKIAGRAYGDILAFDRIAQANNIQNPNLIEPGMVLTIPR